jgi:hypothetical protein
MAVSTLHHKVESHPLEEIGVADTKYDTFPIEDVAVVREKHAISVMPESIRHMSPEERAREIEKMVRKIDCIIP